MPPAVFFCSTFPRVLNADHIDRAGASSRVHAAQAPAGEGVDRLALAGHPADRAARRNHSTDLTRRHALLAEQVSGTGDRRSAGADHCRSGGGISDQGRRDRRRNLSPSRGFGDIVARGRPAGRSGRCPPRHIRRLRHAQGRAGDTPGRQRADFEVNPAVYGDAS